MNKDDRNYFTKGAIRYGKSRSVIIVSQSIIGHALARQDIKILTQESTLRRKDQLHLFVSEVIKAKNS